MLCWGHFSPKWAGAVGCSPFLCCRAVFHCFAALPGTILDRFRTVPNRFQIDFGPYEASLEPFLGRFLAHVGSMLAALAPIFDCMFIHLKN